MKLYFFSSDLITPIKPMIRIKQLVTKFILVLFIIPFLVVAEEEVNSGETPQGTQINHNIGMSPLGLIFGVYAFDYTLFVNKNAFGVMGGPIYTKSSWAEQTGFVAGGFYTYNFDYFKNNPSFIGTAIVYSASSGSVQLGREDTYMADFEAVVGSLNLFYGHSYVWGTGFTMTWRLGAALPVIWDYNWTRPEEISEDQFEDDTDFYETVGKVVGTLLGGSGFEIGWSF